MSKISLDGVHSLRLETDYFQSEKTIIIKNRGRLFQRVQKQLSMTRKMHQIQRGGDRSRRLTIHKYIHGGDPLDAQIITDI